MSIPECSQVSESSVDTSDQGGICMDMELVQGLKKQSTCSDLGGVNVLLWIPVKVGSSLPGSQEGAPAVSRGSQWPRQRDLYPVMGGPPLMAPRSKDHSKEPRCLGATEWSLHISFWQLSLAMSKVHLCAGEGWCHPGRLYTFQRICVHMCMHFRMEWSPSCVISHMGLCTLMSDL